jgi:hypothetical protein
MNGLNDALDPAGLRDVMEEDEALERERFSTNIDYTWLK